MSVSHVDLLNIPLLETSDCSHYYETNFVGDISLYEDVNYNSNIIMTEQAKESRDLSSVINRI